MKPLTRVCEILNNVFENVFEFMNLMYFAVVIIIIKNMYLLTEWEGRMGKYLVRGHGVRTECRKCTFRNVHLRCYFDRKVGIYIAAKLF